LCIGQFLLLTSVPFALLAAASDADARDVLILYPNGVMAKVAVLAVLHPANTASSDCGRRLEAALWTRQERPSASYPAQRLWP